MTLIGALLIAEILSAHDSRYADKRFLLRMLPGLMLWLSVAVWAWLQAFPGLPESLVHPLWAETSTIIGRPVTATISLDPEATRIATIRFLTYGAVFWIAARFCQNYIFATTTLKWFVAASGLYALYGFVVYVSGNETILWFEKWAYHRDLTSTFVNRNTYATFAGLGFLASVILTIDSMGRALRGNETARQFLSALIEWIVTRSWMPVSAMVLTFIALLLTHSRGGLLSTCLGFLILLIAVIRSGLIGKRVGYGLIVATIFAGVAAFNLSGEVVLKRLGTTSTVNEARPEVYARTLDAISSNPWLGTGYGTYEHAFMAYKSEKLSGFNWDKAHSSYLELAMELGVPATIAIGLAFIWLLVVNISGLIRRRRRKSFAVLGLAAIILVAAHALVDFSLQIPGFTVAFALIAGMAWGQSWPTEPGQGAR
ncbi:MAG: O-antigen ligase family protein [Rhodospirillales bacterium]|nr:O-antigen ligase family protein [Rhodospirillales bacterium]MDP6644966.1 O-antigen ligase family protein [Rhodospirillales bacterium]